LADFSVCCACVFISTYACIYANNIYICINVFLGMFYFFNCPPPLSWIVWGSKTGIPVRELFSILVQNDLADHPASYTMDTESLSWE
jgi:hypothetical protein